MTVELKITKRSFKNERGEQQTYYSYTAEMFDEVIVFKPKDEDKKFLRHNLDKLDIPIESENSVKEALVKKILSGESLTDAEQALLKKVLADEEK